MIRSCGPDDLKRLYHVVNEAAEAYRGHIPPECFHEPYMPWSELVVEAETITFLGWEDAGELVGMMGWQQVHDETLIRHAYVLPAFQGRGIGSQLLAHIVEHASTPTVLVGTWAGATWAVRFYRRHGFGLRDDTEQLLARYWSVPPAQVAASVVLALART